MKLLSIDIESSPCLAHVWSLWDQHIGLNQLLEVTEMLCFAAKWYGTPRREMMFYSQYDDGKDAMIEAAWELLNEADAVMSYNGRRFDIKHLNREFAQAGIKPPSPFRQIDLLQVVKKQFAFPSNKLAYVSKALGCKGKLDTGGHELWIRCMSGDAKAWKTMQRYNEMDVYLLEELHDKLLPWIPNYPHRGLLDGDDRPLCSCGGPLTKQGRVSAGTSLYQQYKCTKCGRWSRGTKALARLDVREVAA